MLTLTIEITNPTANSSWGRIHYDCKKATAMDVSYLKDMLQEAKVQQILKDVCKEAGIPPAR